MASTNTDAGYSGSNGEKDYSEHTNVTNGAEGEQIPIREQRRRTIEEMEGVGGLRGLLANPFVFATAVFASLGGLLFGCKYTPACI